MQNSLRITRPNHPALLFFPAHALDALGCRFVGIQFAEQFLRGLA